MKTVLKKIFLCCLFLCGPLSSQRVNFVHIPKCGGTTITRILKPHFEDVKTYPLLKLNNRLVDNASTKADMEEASRIHPDIDHDLVTGHFPIWFHKRKNLYFEKSYVFTVLRDPIERVLSHDRDRIREHHLPSDPLYLPANMMCRMLCSDCTLEGEELVRDCLANLMQMDYVIFMDDFDQGVRFVLEQLGIPPLKKIEHTNSTDRKDLHDSQRVSPKLIEKIKERNSLDIQLYQLAKIHLSHKR